MQKWAIALCIFVCTNAAFALTPEQTAVLFGNNWPALQANFLTANSYSTRGILDSSSIVGNRTTTDSSGRITFSPANMVAYSQNYALTWNNAQVSVTTDGTISPDGTSAANLLTATGASAQVNQANLINDGGTFILSTYIKAGTAPWVVIYASDAVANYAAVWVNTATMAVGTTTAVGTFSNASATTPEAVAGGFYRISLRFSKPYSAASSVAGLELTDADGTFSSTVGRTGYGWGTQLERVTYQTSPGPYIATTANALYLPRYDYDGSTTPARARGLLIENAKANYLAYSQNFTLAPWSPGSSTVNATSATLAPDGTQTAAILTYVSGGARVTQNVNPVNLTAFSYSVYVKAVGVDDGASLLIYSLTTSSVVAQTSYATIASGTNVGNGWYRLQLLVPSVVSGQNLIFYIYPNNYGNNPGSIYIWGAQVENGLFVSSYIPTDSSAGVVRNSDIISLKTPLFSLMKNFAGTAIIEIGDDNNGVVNVPSGYLTSDTAFVMYKNNASTTLFSYNGSSALTYGAISNFATVNRVGIAWSNSRSGYINGTIASSQTGVLALTPFTTVYLGGSGGNIMSGHLRSAAFYGKRLPNQVLKEKTTVGAPY